MLLEGFKAYGHPNALNFILGIIFVLIQVGLVLHILLNKRHVRSTTGWIGVVLLSPILGGLAYYFLGISRVVKSAKKIRDPFKVFSAALPSTLPANEFTEQYPEIVYLQKLGCSLGLPDYTQGNRVQVLVNGDEAFPVMLDEIGKAQRSIALCSYIFDYDETGLLFIDALVAAKQRGVEIRVLIDDVGIRYSRKKMTRELQNRGIRAASFLPAFSKGTFRYFNMRNHRKMMLVDGECGFLGGMNIRHGNVLSKNPKSPIQDLHFRVEGSLVKQINEVFQMDWEFTTGERVELPFVSKTSSEIGGQGTYARIVADGPDNDEDRLRWLMFATLSLAKRSLKILTPYFLPDEELAEAMEMAALKGVRVELLLPSKSNLMWMDVPMRSYFKSLLKRGVHIFLSPHPFDHSKLFLMDDAWVMAGSANWDERSLCLNFELNFEAFDRDLNQRLSALFETKKAKSREVHLAEVERWSIPKQLGQEFLRLFYPYL